MELILPTILIGLFCIMLYSLYEKERELNDLKSRKESIEVHAKEKALRILEDARDKSLGMLRDVRINAEDLIQSLDRRVDAVSKAELDSYKNTIQNISKTVETDALREIKEFREALQLETIGVQKAVAVKVENEYDAVKKEIEIYRQKRLHEIDAVIVDIVKQVLKNSLGRSIDKSIHSELIMESLQKAKEQHVVS